MGQIEELQEFIKDILKNYQELVKLITESFQLQNEYSKNMIHLERQLDQVRINQKTILATRGGRYK